MQNNKKRIIVNLIQTLFVQPQSNDTARLEHSKHNSTVYILKISILL